MSEATLSKGGELYFPPRAAVDRMRAETQLNKWWRVKFLDLDTMVEFQVDVAAFDVAFALLKVRSEWEQKEESGLMRRAAIITAAWFISYVEAQDVTRESFGDVDYLATKKPEGANL